jgi:hypothetical protein
MPAVVLDNAQPDRTRFGQPALPFFTCPVLLPPGMTVQAARVARRARVERVPLTGPLAFNNQPYTGYDMTDPAQARAWALANHEDARLYATDAVYPAAPRHGGSGSSGATESPIWRSLRSATIPRAASWNWIAS